LQDVPTRTCKILQESLASSNSEWASKIRLVGWIWTNQNLFFGKYSKNKNFQFFSKKSYTAFLAICQRHRHLDKIPVPAPDLHWRKRTSQYRPKKGHNGIGSLGFDQDRSCAGTGNLSRCRGRGKIARNAVTQKYEFCSYFSTTFYFSQPH
jgi:hypothetical protein